MSVPVPDGTRNAAFTTFPVTVPLMASDAPTTVPDSAEPFCCVNENTEGTRAVHRPDRTTGAVSPQGGGGGGGGGETRGSVPPP